MNNRRSSLRVSLISMTTSCCLVLTAMSHLLAQDWPPTIQAGHKGYEAGLVQSLVNEFNGNSNLAVDGDFGNGTKAAVKAFQSANGLTSDGIVGPQTWKKLFSSRERYVLTFEVETSPANVTTTVENDSLYECKVSRQAINESGIGTASAFRGSIMPDNLDEKGRIKNGFYILHLGFHKRLGQIPNESDLVVKTTGTLRPCIVVNQDENVPVESNDPNKTTSNAIHVHNGYNNERGSDGCQTISPSQWSSFIKHYLDKYGSLNDWSMKVNNSHTYRGKEIGFLIVK